jgi:putative oxidoreductase
MASIAAIIGRILLAVLFIASGVTKLMTVQATNTMIVGAGLPGGLAIPIGVFELVAGLFLAIGLMTRLASLLLVVFVLLTTLFFHMELTDPMQQAMALKNLAICGGLLMVFAHSHLWYGWDRINRDRRGELAAREAEERAREAELRAARAEGAAEAARENKVVVERD